MSKAAGARVALKDYTPTRDGYTFDGWFSDKDLTTAVTEVTLSKDVTVYAKWTKAEDTTPPDDTTPPADTETFVDVPKDAFFHDAVYWAVDNNITNGTDKTHFSPDAACTRAQMVTLLWRAVGEPSTVATTVNPFTDVAEDAYYYGAVLWAVEKGITLGTSDTTFSPDDTVTRAQAVTFLFRHMGQAGTDENPFTDVAADAYYYNAVLWAVAEEITNGTSDTTFSPDDDCLRSQIVTFLYRALT